MKKFAKVFNQLGYYKVHVVDTPPVSDDFDPPALFGGESKRIETSELKKEILKYIDTLTDPMERVCVRHTLRIIDEWSKL